MPLLDGAGWWEVLRLSIILCVVLKYGNLPKTGFSLFMVPSPRTCGSEQVLVLSERTWPAGLEGGKFPHTSVDVHD